MTSLTEIAEDMVSDSSTPTELTSLAKEVAEYLFDNNVFASSGKLEAFEAYPSIAVIEIDAASEANQLISSEGDLAQLANSIYEKAPDKYEAIIIFKEATNDFTISSTNENGLNRIGEFISENFEVDEANANSDFESFFNENASTIHSLMSENTETRTETETRVPRNTPNSSLVGYAWGGGVLLSGVILISVFGSRIMKARNEKEKINYEEKIPTNSMSHIKETEPLLIAVNELNDLSLAHRYIKKSLSNEISEYSNLLEELDKRMKRSKNPERFGVARLEIVELNKTIIHALGKTYYIDIAQNSELWSNPEGRLKETADALDKITILCRSFIKDVNADRDIDIRSSLSIIENRTATGINEEITLNLDF